MSPLVLFALPMEDYIFLLLGQSGKLEIKLCLGSSSKYISDWNQDLGNEIGICLFCFGVVIR